MASLGVTGKIRYSAADQSLLENAGRLIQFMHSHDDESPSTTSLVDCIGEMAKHIKTQRAAGAKQETAAARKEA